MTHLKTLLRRFDRYTLVVFNPPQAHSLAARSSAT